MGGGIRQLKEIGIEYAPSGSGLVGNGVLGSQAAPPEPRSSSAQSSKSSPCSGRSPGLSCPLTQVLKLVAFWGRWGGGWSWLLGWEECMPAALF